MRIRRRWINGQGSRVLVVVLHAVQQSGCECSTRDILERGFVDTVELPRVDIWLLERPRHSHLQF